MKKKSKCFGQQKKNGFLEKEERKHFKNILQGCQLKKTTSPINHLIINKFMKRCLIWFSCYMRLWIKTILRNTQRVKLWGKLIIFFEKDNGNKMVFLEANKLSIKIMFRVAR